MIYCLGVVVSRTGYSRFRWVLQRYYANANTTVKMPDGPGLPRWKKDRDFEPILLAYANVQSNTMTRPPIPDHIARFAREKAQELGLTFRPEVKHNVSLGVLEAIVVYTEEATKEEG